MQIANNSNHKVFQLDELKFAHEVWDYRFGFTPFQFHWTLKNARYSHEISLSNDKNYELIKVMYPFGESPFDGISISKF